MNNVQGIVSVGLPTTIGANTTDLSLDIEVNSTLYSQYEGVEYIITATNEGTTTATNVEIAAGLPEGMVFSGSQVSDGDYSLFNELWSISEIAPGETATLYLDLFTLIGGENITNFVEVIALDGNDADSTPDNGNGVSANEDDEAAITITPAEEGGFGGQEGEANLSLTLESDVNNYEQYENISFIVTLVNDGPDAANNIVVAAALPNGTAYRGHSNTDGDYSAFNEKWTIESLESGETATLYLDLFALINQGNITAYAEVFAVGQIDPNSTPANGNGVSANEDDEAVLGISPVTQFNLLSSTIVENSEILMDKIYPVPTVNDLNLVLVNQGDTKEVGITVYNLQGKQMMFSMTTLNEGWNEYKMDVNSLTDGQYFIHVLGPNGTVTYKRFVKVAQ